MREEEHIQEQEEKKEKVDKGKGHRGGRRENHKSESKRV